MKYFEILIHKNVEIYIITILFYIINVIEFYRTF
jgi:hypothetical protein